MVAKNTTSGNLLTLDAFQEMIELNDIIYEDIWEIRLDIELPGGIIIWGGDPAYHDSICKKNTLLADIDGDTKKASVDKNVSHYKKNKLSQ